MLRDITIGQFFPGNSLLHKLDPRVKLVITFFSILVLFLIRNFLGLGVLLFFAVVSALVSKVSPRVLWKSFRTIFFIIVFTSAFQLFYHKDGVVLWKPFENFEFAVTDVGIYTAVFISVRMIVLILISSLLTYTTSPTMLTDAIERLLSPLQVFHIKVHALAMMMTIALRFIPTLIEELEIIISAQKARGAKLDDGNLIERLRALTTVFIPLFVSAFRRAADLAVAMECRCYSDAPGRTRLTVMRLHARDYIVCVFLTVLFAGLLYTSFASFDGIWILKSVI